MGKTFTQLRKERNTLIAKKWRTHRPGLKVILEKALERNARALEAFDFGADIPQPGKPGEIHYL